MLLHWGTGVGVGVGEAVGVGVGVAVAAAIWKFRLHAETGGVVGDGAGAHANCSSL